jgi:hypothetical protein
MEEYLISPEQMLRRGLRAVGCGSKVQARRYKKTNVKNFKAHYGPHPNHCATIWKDILVIYSLLDSPDEVNLRGFFLGLHFLRNYPKNDRVRSTTFDNIEEKKMCLLTKFWVQKIASLKEYKIVWYTEEEMAERTFLCSIDGSHKICRETRDHPTKKVNPDRFSFKHNTAGYNVQVAVDIFEQKIRDITVSIGKENDKSNLNKSRVLTKCPPGKRIIVDGGFTGDADKLSGYNQFDLDITKWVKKRVKSRVESYNKRMNDYECMKGIFWHGDEWFNDCAVAVRTSLAVMS